MNVLLTTLNSKYIHTNLAIRYLKAYSQDEHDITIHEFTIKDDINNIIDTIENYNTEIIGFSIYIWNILKTIEVINELKQRHPNIIIIIGGPEVSYDINHWFKTIKTNFIISGEGEYPFKKLLDYIIRKKGSLNKISGLSYKENNKVYTNENDYVIDLDTIPTPYQFKKDKPNLSTRIAYVEASRGCPFHCSYCMASLENKVRYFNIDFIKKQLLYLMNNGVKTFKFLDRTFNTKTGYAKEIFDFIIQNHKEGTQFQFEVYADIFPEELIDYLNENAPRNLFRFEIGIQSTNELTNKLINRKQNWEKLKNNIEKIQKGNKIDLHLDLIAGLPEEGYQSFIKTFNDVFSLKAKELQLGFLKMLRGTPLRNNNKKWEYIYDENPPYEIKKHSKLSPEEIQKIHLAEEMLEKYSNTSRFTRTLEFIFSKHFFKSPYHFFEELGLWWTGKYKMVNYQLDQLYKRLYDFLNYKNIKSKQILSYLKIDYLTNSKIKPKIWWEKTIDKKQRNLILRELFKNNLIHYSLDELYKYALVEDISINNYNYFIIVFKPNDKKYYFI